MHCLSCLRCLPGGCGFPPSSFLSAVGRVPPVTSTAAASAFGLCFAESFPAVVCGLPRRELSVLPRSAQGLTPAAVPLGMFRRFVADPVGATKCPDPVGATKCPDPVRATKGMFRRFVAHPAHPCVTRPARQGAPWNSQVPPAWQRRVSGPMEARGRVRRGWKRGPATARFSRYINARVSCGGKSWGVG